MLVAMGCSDDGPCSTVARTDLVGHEISVRLSQWPNRDCVDRGILASEGVALWKC